MVCVLVLLICFAAVGATCAVCLSAHPAQLVERSAAPAPLAALPVERLLPLALLLFWAPALLVTARVRARGRASPAELQRFLF